MIVVGDETRKLESGLGNMDFVQISGRYAVKLRAPGTERPVSGGGA